MISFLLSQVLSQSYIAFCLCLHIQPSHNYCIYKLQFSVISFILSFWQALLEQASVEEFQDHQQIVMAKHTASGSSLLVVLADDILSVIGLSLSPRDICNLSMCCKRLSVPMSFEKAWLTRCEELGVLSPADLVGWRREVSSYKALYRFLTTVKPLLGIWVHQNPELGNVVYVMPGFASVVGCRVIPQKLGPSGLEGSPILWAPVFEVISDDNGAPVFVLHGREKGRDYICPGTVKSIEKTCDVLLLEVEPKEKNRDGLVHIESLRCHLDEGVDKEVPSSVRVPFSKLSFDDTKKLLEEVTVGVRIQAPDPAYSSLFPCLRGDEDRFRKDIAHLSERRSMLIKMHKHGRCTISWNASHELSYSDSAESAVSAGRNTVPVSWTQLFRERVSRIWSELKNRSKIGHEQPASSEESKDAELDDFLRSGDTIGLTFKASAVGLYFYKTWPVMRYNLYALYKIPIQLPTVGQEYTGLWGGTFGWPPGKPGKALVFLNLSYYEKSGKIRLLANRILEGLYANHPNGSTMFTVNVGKPSTEPFPWSLGADSLPIDVKHTFIGKGIASGYGFRYPSSTPGSLFVLEDGVLAFVWKEPSKVLTLQRLNLEELLKKGQRVPSLPPLNNFVYLDRSYRNVFTDL